MIKLRFFSPADEKNGQIILRHPPAKNQYRSYSETERQFLVDNWQTMTIPELANALNRSKAGLQTYAWRVLQLKKTPEAKLMARSKGQQSRQDAFTEVEKQFLIDNWQTKTIQQIADALGRTYGSIKSKGQKQMRLKKTPEAYRSLMQRPNAGQFQKGQIPPNTILDEEMPIRVRHGHKKRGAPPYKWIRVAWKQWKQYHLWLWEQANGPVPEGMIIVFKNKDTMDCRLDNLEMISQQENARRNSGSVNLPDGYVAHLLAVRQPELQAELLNHPDLLEVKRNQIRLNRLLNQLDHATSNPSTNSY